MDQFYFNFYFFGSLLACLFSIYVTFFFLSIKDRSKAAFHLGLSTLAMTIFHLAYIIAFISFDQWTIIHRWLAIPSPMMGFTQCFIFFFYFPNPRNVKFGLTVYSILYAGLAIVEATFVAITLQSDHRFNIGSNYWDFESHKFYKIFSIIILIYNFSFLASATWRAIVERGKERRWIIYIAIAYSTITIIPGILNVMSRDGSVSRKVFQHTTDIALVAGLFLVLIIYANATKERTTILSKIVAVTMATFLLAFQLVGYAILNGYETSYDTLKVQASELAAFQGKKPEGFAYLLSFDPDSKEFILEKGEKDPRFDSEDRLEIKFFNVTRKLTNLGTLNAKERWERSKVILSNSPKEFYAYSEAIKSFYHSKGESKVSDAELIDFFRFLNKKLNIIKNKFSNLPSKNDPVAVTKLLNSEEIGLQSVLEQVRKKVEKDISSGKSELEVRSSFILPLTSLREVGERMYRGARFNKADEKTPEFYLAYLVIHPQSEKIYEVGFTYKSFREYLHVPSLVMVICLLVMIVTISFGFRFFFHNAIVKPMEEVVVGLTEVNSGNLEYRLVPRVEDEIGFIARSFNRMARSIQAARKRLEQYANELEEKVKDRTKELEQTLNEVQELKQQQDADYFLTSLLIKPLGSNKANQENVKVEFLLKQKKRFTFRKHEDEIGGDLNISNHIDLQGRSYTVFLNGDAMGKSMQGAGGALVLGSVFESIIERTRVVDTIKKQSPERWLKNAFIELHKVFESFDGSMLVSSVIGLVDDELGILYYINAEHPWTVLYRDGIASFIENEFMFRKLGTTGVEGTIFIKTFQLEPGDCIFVGSDGRDDIIVGMDSDGDRIINDDEKLFLNSVEKGRGDLQEIYNVILNIGKLSDDLSLIRLSFTGNGKHTIAQDEKRQRIKELLRNARETFLNKDTQEALSYLEEAESLDSRVPEVKKNFIKLFLKLKDYQKAARYAEDYFKMNPIDSEILYVASFAARKAGQIRKALDFSERLRLREPSHIKNLINLAEIYMAVKNFDRANSILKDAIRLDPLNESISKIEELLKKYSDRFSNENGQSKES
ncbi:SpoIIE family protein phosphatase [Leptospira saintgironsiae]|uniref:Stage II sporulation protein E n=1 Tax=Leptospira saintgironsiae TaxID=2023183 RepID=A0A2M9Y7Z6_9LEPT|nr:SpoIIE family protein phosphatase [Leptospira saintgironsiae]PJZ47573.1 stage II sporulation protein E [Leptospira saintgironsiae]